MKTIPFCRPYIGRQEVKAIKKVIKSGFVAQGGVVEEFERKFAEYTGAKYAIAVSSGTSALFLSLKAMGVGAGDSVAVPSLTFTASASVIEHCGANIEFLDVDKETMCLQKPAKARKKPKCVISVALTGNVPPIYKDVPTIVDSAHWIDRNCHIGKLQTYSFHGTKNMTTGFGGMVTTNNKKLAKFIKKARNHGLHKREWEQGVKDSTARWGYDVEFCGWKMNMNNIQAAMGIEQLKKLDWMNYKRDKAVQLYNCLLGLERRGNHLYPVFVKDRDRFIKQMKKAGIECSVHFEPLHKMKAYKKYKTGKLLNTTWLGAHMVSLPLFPTLKHKDIRYICQKVLDSQLLVSDLSQIGTNQQ